MFERLFNHPLHVWRQATLVFESGWSLPALCVAVALALAVVAFTLTRLQLSLRRRVLVGVLQGIALTGLLFMLWRPALQVEQLRNGENTVAWLLDGSRSMDTLDVDGQPRREAMLDALDDPSLFDTARFEHRFHAIGRIEGDSADPLDEPAVLPADREGSALPSGIDSLLTDVDGRGLAAVVLAGDGASTEPAPDAAWWNALAGAGVPVHTIGVGRSERVDDIELADVTLPERTPVGGTVAARVTIAHPPGAPAVRLRIERGATLLHVEDIALDPDAERTRHVARFVSDEPGLADLRFSLSGDEPDRHPANDVQHRLLQVDEQRRRVLYVEGEPRWEFKFLRRAVHADPQLEVVSLLRTSANKFYRQGVRDADELADGFPRDREELFAYDAVVIGSLSAAELDLDQQAALRDFVSVRGGSLLMLAGRSGLADGGWARSAVAPALPVTLDTGLDAETFRRERTALFPTRQGLRREWLSLAEPDTGEPERTNDASRSAWSGLPEVADRQSVGRPKPGAVVLLEMDDGEPAWVTQRYGLGSSHVFGTSGTWRWQMSLPVEDRRHERFWSNVLAMLVAERPDRLRIDVPMAVMRDGSAQTAVVTARDERFEMLGADALSVIAIAPDGERTPIRPSVDADAPGRFLVSVPADADGPWALEVSAASPGESPASVPTTATARWLVEADTAEDFDRLQHRDLLERIADVSGGSYLPLERIDELPALLARDNAADTRQARLPLWNMPALFLLILLAKGGEWIARLRWRRL